LSRSKLRFQAKKANISNFTVPTIIPINKPPTAIKINISYHLNKNATEEQQLSTFGFVFDQATEEQKHMVKPSEINLILYPFALRLSIVHKTSH
jgi:hypothetical protein